jgi:hypothetical protein
VELRVFIDALMPKSARNRASCKGDPAKEAGIEQQNELKGSQRQPLFDPRDWITQAEAARIRRVTRQAIAKLVTKGKLTTLEIAGSTFVKRADVEAFRPSRGGRPTAR